MVPVLVDERMRDLRGLPGRDDDPGRRSRAAVARRRAGAAARAQLVGGDDVDRHALDLVGVRRATEQARVPLDVHVRSAHVEGDRPALVVLRRDRIGERCGRRDEGGDGHDDGEDAAHPVTVPAVGSSR
jgi:hypothetical protein